MLSQFVISILATMLAVTSPLLHYWGCAETASTPAKSSCCQHAHDATPHEQQPSEAPDCGCESRVAVTNQAPCDITELAAQPLPGNDLVAIIATNDSNIEQAQGMRIALPAHFLLPAEGGSLCARLGRFLL